MLASCDGVAPGPVDPAPPPEPPAEGHGSRFASDALTGGLVEGTREAEAVLRFVNAASEVLLVDAVGWSSAREKVAAAHVQAYRLGEDGQSGTADDQRFETLADLDAIPFVGALQFQKLLFYVQLQGMLPAPAADCSWESAFFERYGQVWNPADLLFVTADGTMVRGTAGVDAEGSFRDWSKTFLKGSASPVVEVRLLRPEIYHVVATRADVKYLKALAMAARHIIRGANQPWGKDVLENAMLRAFTMDEPTAPQANAYVRILLQKHEANVSEGEREKYRAAAQALLSKLEAGKLDRRGSTEADGWMGDAAFGSYQFLLRIPYGFDPGLQLKGPGVAGEPWVSHAVSPRCGGCVREGKYVSCRAKPWLAAEAHCVSLGGHLASVHSTHENMAVAALTDAASTWLGLAALDQPGSFGWVDETPVDYLNFLAGQPDNWRSEERCVELLMGGAPGQDYRGSWNDLACATERDFVCKVP